MAEEEKVYPPGAEPPKEPEPPKPEAPKEETPAETPAPEPEKGEEKKEEDPPKPDEPPVKKRSIYDDLKDTRKEKNVWRDTALAALKAQGVEVKGNETPEQLQALITEHKTPDAPKEPEAPLQPEKPEDELEKYAKEQGLDPAALSQLVDIVTKRIPGAKLSEEDQQALKDLQDWRTQQRRVNEDAEIDTQMPAVKATAKELGFEIHDDTEAAAVMAEVKRLAHTKEFHDKPVDYIIFAKRAELSKLVSPKKPSFESGTGNRAEGSKDEQVDFGTGAVTPTQAQKATEGGIKGSYEIRRS